MKHFISILLFLGNVAICSEEILEAKPAAKYIIFDEKLFAQEEEKARESGHHNEYIYQKIIPDLCCNLIFIANTHNLENYITIKAISRLHEKEGDRVSIAENGQSLEFKFQQDELHNAFYRFLGALCYAYDHGKKLVIDQSLLSYLAKYASESGSDTAMSILFKGIFKDKKIVTDLYITLDITQKHDLLNSIDLFLPFNKERSMQTVSEIESLITQGATNDLVNVYNTIYQEYFLQEELNYTTEKLESEYNKLVEKEKEKRAAGLVKDSLIGTLGAILFQSTVHKIQDPKIKAFLIKNESKIGLASRLTFEGLKYYSAWQTLNKIGSLRSLPFWPQTLWGQTKLLWNTFALLSITSQSLSTIHDIYGYTKAGAIRLKEKLYGNYKDKNKLEKK